MDCAEARLLASARLDRPLTPGEATNLDAHLARCSACRAFARDLATNDRLLREGWAPAEVSASFADRVVAALPPRAAARPTPSSRRRALIAAALLLACLAGTVGADRVRAGVALVLRQVALRESPPPTAPALTVPLTRVTLGEARQLVPWPIRQPDPPPDGYRLLWVDAGAVYAFADGPAILLTYGPVTGEPRLAITQFRARAGEEIVGPVAPGAAREVPVGAGRGLAIEGRWVVRDGRQVWERGTLVRLIVERGDIVIQLEADPRAGWDADRLAALAEDLR